MFRLKRASLIESNSLIGGNRWLVIQSNPATLDWFK